MGNIDEGRPPLGAEAEGKRGGEGSRGLPPDAESDADKRAADSAFDDLIIEVDESELEAELKDQPPGRKY